MNTFFSRITENVLFTVLILAVVGWTAGSVAAGQTSQSVGTCAVARAATPAMPALAAAPAPRARCAA
jgi:hypothetical protein